MTVQLEFEAEHRLVVVRATGVLTRDKMDVTKQTVAELMQAHGKLSVLIAIEDEFINLDALGHWEDGPVDDYLQKHVNHIAILGDLRWRDRALLFFMSAWLPHRVEFFPPNQEVLARAWLLHDDGSPTESPT